MRLVSRHTITTFKSSLKFGSDAFIDNEYEIHFTTELLLLTIIHWAYLVLAGWATLCLLPLVVYVIKLSWAMNWWDSKFDLLTWKVLLNLFWTFILSWNWITFQRQISDKMLYLGHFVNSIQLVFIRSFTQVRFAPIYKI